MVSFISDGKGTAFFIIRKTKSRKNTQKISTFGRAIVDFRRYRLFFDLFLGAFLRLFSPVYRLFFARFSPDFSVSYLSFIVLLPIFV